MSGKLVDLEREAWRLGWSGDRDAINDFCSKSELHSMIMSGRIKFSGRPRSQSGFPLFPLPNHKHKG